MGRRHLRAYAALARFGLHRFSIDAVCDPRPGAAEQAAELAADLLGRWTSSRIPQHTTSSCRRP
jgi:hypothetical protein